MESIEILEWDREVPFLPIEEVDISGARFWGFDTYLAQVVVVGLRRFRNEAHGFPESFESFEEWQSVIDEILEGFELYIEPGDRIRWLREGHPDRIKWDNSRALLMKWWEAFWD